MAAHGFDVVIVGGGNGGMAAAVPTRQAGLRVALLEPGELGGTSSSRGCTPMQVLAAAAGALDGIASAAAHAISVGPAKLDWAALIDRKTRIVAPISDSLARELDKRGVHLVRAHGHFVAPNAVRAGGHIHEADHVVIATGAKPRPLSVPGAELAITSGDLLSDRNQPRDIVFIGGGPVAFEFAHVCARAGIRATILQAGGRFLGHCDPDAVAELVAETRRIGIDARSGVAVYRIEPGSGERLRVVFEQDGRERSLEADRVVNAAGRIPNLAGLDLESGNVAVDRGHILRDDHLRSTSNRSVWIVGDVLRDSRQRSPVAAYEGRIAGQNIVDGPKHRPDYTAIPSCVFTLPALASVGMSEEEARDAGLDVHVAVSDMREWLSGQIHAAPAAWSKVLSERASGRIVGAHLVGHGAAELIHLFALAMRHGITARDLGDLVCAFPTFAADLRHML